MSENQYSSKPKHVLLECFIFHKKKIKFRGRNGATNQEVNDFMVMEHL